MLLISERSAKVTDNLMTRHQQKNEHFWFQTSAQK